MTGQWVQVALGHWRYARSASVARRLRPRNVGEEWARMCRRVIAACSDTTGWGRWGYKGMRAGGRRDEIARAVVRGGWVDAPRGWRVRRALRYLNRRRQRYHGCGG